MVQIDVRREVLDYLEKSKENNKSKIIKFYVVLDKNQTENIQSLKNMYNNFLMK